MIWALLVGCGAPSPAEVDAALTRARGAVGSALVVAELLEHVDAEPVRHDGCGACPCTERLGTADFYTLLEDYAAEPGPLVEANDGCVPSSGLVPAEIRGHVWLDVIDGEVSTIRAEEATLDGRPLVPALDAAWERVGEGWEAEAGCDLEVGELRSGVRLAFTRDADRLVADGTVEIGGLPVDFEGVTFEPSSFQGGCAAPSAGVLHVRPPGRMELRAEPGGEVELSHGGRAARADWCAQAGPFLE